LLKIHLMKMTRKRFMSGSSCDRGSAALDYPNVPLIQDPPTGLEASLPAPLRKLRNVACKRVVKKLKVTETTSQEVNSSSRVVE
jgi:hypothetical protein